MYPPLRGLISLASLKTNAHGGEEGWQHRATAATIPYLLIKHQKVKNLIGRYSSLLVTFFSDHVMSQLAGVFTDWRQWLVGSVYSCVGGFIFTLS